MVYFISPAVSVSQNSLPVDAFLDLLGEVERYDERERYMVIAEALHRLTGELDYVENFIREMLETRSDYQIVDGYGDTSLILGGTDKYRLRLVKWTPMEAIHMPHLNRVGLSYGFVHNHDFHLVTKGIFGDGYQTDVYRCDAGSLAGAVGEDVDLSFQGRFRLSPGSVMWYEQYHDVHDQIAPKSLSLSFNVIPVDPTVTYPQLSYDPLRGKVAGFTRNRQARVLSSLSLLTDFAADDQTLDLLRASAAASRNDWLKRGIAALIADRYGIPFEAVLDEFEVSIAGDPGRFAPDAFSVRHIA